MTQWAARWVEGMVEGMEVLVTGVKLSSPALAG